LPEHGGRLNAAAARYGIARADWLDLSTGINPHGWSPPALPAACWNRLPEPDDGLDAAVQAHYGRAALVTAGSQAAILALPRLRAAGRIGILGPTYAEHAHAWAQAGHTLQTLTAAALPAALERLDGLVVVNPDNPSARRLPAATLLDWHARLAAHGGWLLVDEAFSDAEPADSLLAHGEREGLIVLRSLGKFFGLAGVRVGFVFAVPALRAALDALLGPWTVAGPSRAVAALALADRDWQAAMRARLAQESGRLVRLLTRHNLQPHAGTALFQWVAHADAADFAERLARRGVLVRHFSEPAGLRFGLPADEAALRRLDLALAGVRAERMG